MKNGKSSREMKFNYNESPRVAPGHRLPETLEMPAEVHPGIRARMLIEAALQSFEGVNTSKLSQLKVTAKDIVKFRKEIKNALYAIIKEENGYDIRLRSGSIAYLGALKFNEAADLIVNIALNTRENSFVRTYATETLGRIKGRTVLAALDVLIHDSVYAVKEKAIRVIGKVGAKKHLRALKAIATADADPEIQFRAKAAIHRITTGKLLQRSRGIRTTGILKTAPEAGNARQIGKHIKVKPQTTFGEAEVRGGMDLIANIELERRTLEKTIRPIAYEIVDGAPKGVTRLILRGDRAGDAIVSHHTGKIYRIHEDEIVLDIPPRKHPRTGCSLDLDLACDRHVYSIHNWLPDAPVSPVIYSVQPDDGVIWAKTGFGLKIKFHVPGKEKTALLKMRIRMPKDNWKDIQLPVTGAELENGEKVVPGFFAAIPGSIQIDTALYLQSGGACKLHSGLMALPANPIFLNVSPSTTGTIGEGPAHYNAAEDKFYCYANLQVSNGFPHAVTLGPKVTARVTDGGTQKDNFSFNISTSVVPANSTRTIGVWMSFGGNTYDVFKDYGDVTIQLTLQTTEGDITDSHVWAAMAQVKLALNFVGNFSATTRSQLQSVVDNEASAIYEQQNLYISESARFLLPSTSGDFGRYRDIEMDDNKDSDCTSGSDEADDLRDDWSSPNESWLDVWCVETLSGPACAASVGGFSPVDGPTGKGGSNSGVIIKMSSADLSTTGGRNLMGIIIAHEAAHFLGLNHHGTSSNFMAASTGGSNTDITHQQYLDMTEHGFVTRFVV